MTGKNVFRNSKKLNFLFYQVQDIFASGESAEGTTEKCSTINIVSPCIFAKKTKNRLNYFFKRICPCIYFILKKPPPQGGRFFFHGLLGS